VLIRSLTHLNDTAVSLLGHDRRKQIYQKYIFLQLTFYSRDPCEIILELELHKSLWGAFEKLQPLEAHIFENTDKHFLK